MYSYIYRKKKYIGKTLDSNADEHFGLLNPHQWSVAEKYFSEGGQKLKIM